MSFASTLHPKATKELRALDTIKGPSSGVGTDHEPLNSAAYCAHEIFLWMRTVQSGKEMPST